jgi:flagellar biosynthetic protein FlhB
MASDAANKSEKPSDKRREDARKEGQFARAQDADGVAATVGVILTLYAMGPTIIQTYRDFANKCFGHPFDVVGGDPHILFKSIGSELLVLCVPTGVIAAVCASAIGFAQAGFHPDFGRLAPDSKRFQPLDRLRSMMISISTVIQITLSAARAIVVGWVAWATLSSAFPLFISLSRSDLGSAVNQVADVAATMSVRCTLALAVLAGADYAQSWLRTEKSLMMSREELKEEFKQQEGDPKIKGRRRARMREILKRGLKKQVSQADVVLANPTHVSVALRYGKKDLAPIVVAKGYDDIALYIRELAKESKIPIVTNKPLARALAKRVKVGKSIPIDLYAAVAEVLAYVYWLKRKATGS